MTIRLAIGLAMTGGALAIVGCSDEASPQGAEAQLDEAYLEPLIDAGFAIEVTEVCHYRRETAGEPWHFQVRLHVGAEPGAVADALADSVGVIRRDHDPIIAQQYVGEPGRGWDGNLDPGTGDAEGSTEIGLVKNNVEVAGDLPPVGWLQVCPTPDE